MTATGTARITRTRGGLALAEQRLCLCEGWDRAELVEQTPVDH
jgi:hypothetical protein